MVAFRHDFVKVQARACIWQLYEALIGMNGTSVAHCSNSFISVSIKIGILLPFIERGKSDLVSGPLCVKS
jgi:hypothetical protein